MDKETIKSILLAHGFTIKQGQTDLKPYVYAAAEALIKYGQQSVVQANVALMIKAQAESQMAFYKATLRQHTATQCMQGLLAYSGERFTSPNQVAGLAIECADALIAELDKELAELKKAAAGAGKRWRGEKLDEYWTVDSFGDADQEYDKYREDDDYLYAAGNYFKTESEAERYRDRLLATQRVKDRIAELNAAEGWVADWKHAMQCKCFAAYDYTRGALRVFGWVSELCLPVELLGSEDAIGTVIEEMPDDLMLMLGIDGGENDWMPLPEAPE